MKEDVSKSAIAVLLVLAIIVSVLSTFAVLNALEQPAQMPVQDVVKRTGSTQGTVGLTILGPQETESQTGTVSLTINRPGDNE